MWGLGLRVRVSGQHDCIVGSALWGLQVRVWPLAFKGSQPLLHSAGERLRHADKGRVRVEESHSGHPTCGCIPILMHYCRVARNAGNGSTPESRQSRA